MRGSAGQADTNPDATATTFHARQTKTRLFLRSNDSLLASVSSMPHSCFDGPGRYQARIHLLLVGKGLVGGAVARVEA
jgi:hypothetical protein